MISGENILFPPKANLGPWHCVQRTCDQCREVWCVFQWRWISADRWKIESTPQGGRLILIWQEKDGPPVATPSHKGFGSRMIESGLAQELEGAVHLDYRPDGVVCTINIPAPRGARGG
ncbi:hypothetical protein [Phyllobacterium zundukense]|uniref:hypothetical protein n=1 Tax=Phyllobacterium zundukense TaxID=1867719 RepID=UPI001F39868D|nr:hypothetical protein [Phyllobacterium zundukense]